MQAQLNWLLNNFIPVPDEWFKDLDPVEKKKLLAPLPCSSYAELLQAWSDAGMQWTDAMDIAFSAMLATVATVKMMEDQLFLRVLGVAGTSKTTFCEAISVNRAYTYPMNATRGFHSGFAAGGDNDLHACINNMTVIMPEGDMLLKAPNKDQICSEIRDMWSGKFRAHFRNGVTYDRDIKTNFILAGTPTLRELNESAAGDRFIDCVIYERAEVDERKLVRSVLRDSLGNMAFESNGSSDSMESEAKTRAKQLTGGFVAYLRDNIGSKLAAIKASMSDNICYDLESISLLVSKMRTRPMIKGENKTESELHIRLSKQFAKLSMGLAMVLGKDQVDKEVMRRSSHLAEDTCYGNTFNICKAIEQLPKSILGLDASAISHKTKLPHEIIRKNLSILISLECIRTEEAKPGNGARRSGTVYRLSVQQQNLMNKLRSLMQVKVK